MSLLFALLAAGSLPTLISGAPLLSIPSSKRAATTYTQYTGSGAPPSWPAQSTWADFDTMFENNESIMKGSCTQFGADNPSDQEISDMKSGIQTVAKETGVDERFILAIMMQESNGCVRAPTTNYGVRNPGLMQDHDGQASCNDGTAQSPCPADTITQMIRDGVAGTSAGDGLKQCIAQAGTDDVSKYYRAARIYNSGSISGDNLSSGVATHCYASDVANRLLGWATAPHDCNLDGADVPVNTSPPAESSSAPTSTSSPAGYSSPAAQSPTTTAAPTTTTSKPAFTVPAFSGFSSFAPPQASAAAQDGGAPADNGAKAAATKTAAASSVSLPPLVPTSTATATSSSSSSSASLAPGVSSSCPQLVTVQDGDSCWTLSQKYGFSTTQFQSWNTQIDSKCSNLWKGYRYCVKGS